MKVIDTITLILVIVGALNWGSIGLFGFDCVAFLCGGLRFLFPARCRKFSIAFACRKRPLHRQLYLSMHTLIRRLQRRIRGALIRGPKPRL